MKKMTLTYFSVLVFVYLSNNLLHELDTAAANIYTLAGTGTNGYSGDGGPATLANFNFPFFITMSAAYPAYPAVYDASSSKSSDLYVTDTV